MDTSGIKPSESQITGPRTYDGVVSRQDLVNHCQDTANKMYQELLREEALLEDTKNMSDDQYETLTFSKQNIIGHIAALREITEWAKDHKLEEV